MKTHSVKYKILLSSLFFVLSVVSVFLNVASDRAVNQRLEYIKVTNDLLAENQSKAAVLPMWNIDYIAVADILNAISESPDFINASFYDDKGYSVAKKENRIARKGEKTFKISKEIRYEYQNQNVYLGRLDVLVGLDRVDVFAEEELQWAVAALLTLVFVLTVLIMASLNYFITNPLSRISKTFSEIAEGNTDVTVPMLERKDEIGDLVRAAQIFQEKSGDLINLERHKKEEAQVANRAKNTFLMRISHELRTPLNGILGFAEMLNNNSQFSNKEYAQTICSLGKKMLSQVDDLLDFSGIENEKITIAPVPSMWRDVMENVVKEAKDEGVENNNEILFLSDVNIPDELLIDSRRMEQVMRHLIRNALKFTHDGCVVINAENLGITPEEIKIRFSVTDNGEGIDREFQSRMFETFSQEDESVTRKFGGIGMGLSISTGLLKLMGSKLQVESQKLEGSKFFFDITIPYEKEKSSIYAFSKPARDVWVWDVSTEWRDNVLDQVNRFGLHAQGFDDLENLRNALYDHKSKPLTVVLHPRYVLGDLESMMTEISLFENVDLVIYKGQDKSIKLPAKSSVIENSITVTSLFGLLEKGVQSSSEAGEYVGVAEAYMEDNMNVLIVEDDLVNQKLATTMLERLGYHGTVANNGQEGVEIFAENSFKFILMDMMMPVMDGLQATRAIRRFKGDRGSVPIIAVTANAYESDKEACFKAGMNGYISKPYDIKRLESEIEKVLAAAES